MRKILVLVLFILVTFSAGWLLDTLWKTGQFLTVTPHFAGSCRLVTGVAGAEDITIHLRTGIAYLSATDRRAIARGETVDGGIYRYDLNRQNPIPTLIPITPGLADGFQPHGISLYAPQAGEKILFAVNHAGGRHSIERFDLHEGRLIHRQTITDRLLQSPNDVAAAGPNRFYVTNDHGFSKDRWRILEEYLQLRQSYVVYCSTDGCQRVADGIGYANGINLSPDGRFVYVTASTEQSLRVYTRQAETGALTLKRIVYLGSGVDNIEIGPKGDLWIAAHPKLLKFKKHASDPAVLSPSQVLRVFQNSAGKYKFEEIYLNRGQELSGSSVAAVYNGRLLIGSVFDAGFLDCHLD